MGKIALLVVFNHRFDRNLPVLDELLKGKWSNVFYIVPFYDGNRKDVITVYENSYQYEGYFAQAYQTLRNYNFDHYVIIGDDMVLNPRLNEDNILSELGIGRGESYFPEIQDLQKGKWDNIDYAACFRLVQKGAEIFRVLPTADEARKRFSDMGYCPTPKISFYTALRNLKGCHIVDLRSFVNLLLKMLKHPFSSIPFEYPFVGGISDFFIVDKESMGAFCHYCGAFAAANLFVEVAVPTSLILSCKKLCTESKLSSYKQGYLWGEDINIFANKYEYNYERLIKNYPKGVLFIHPVKLSKWK